MAAEREISDSRFYMWRAVFALAHADGELSRDEIEFVVNYMEELPFTADQKDIIVNDLKEQQSINEMWIGISDAQDQADFFQFAQMMAVSDDDYDEAERKIIETITSEQMNRFNKGELSRQIREARAAAQLRRAVEGREYKRQAKEILGMSNIMRALVPWMQHKGFPVPDADMFALMRAVFALAHVDGHLSDDERDYINGMMDVYRFTDEQRRIIDGDTDNTPDVMELFFQIEEESYRREFFVLARAMIWSDGEFHPAEREILEGILNRLGDDALEYEDVTAWVYDENASLPDVKLAQSALDRAKLFFKELFEFSEKK